MTRNTYPESVTPINTDDYSDAIQAWLYTTCGYIQAAQIINYHQHNQLTPEQIHDTIAHMFHVDRAAGISLSPNKKTFTHNTVVNNRTYEITYQRIDNPSIGNHGTYSIKEPWQRVDRDSGIKYNDLFAPTVVSVVEDDDSTTPLARGTIVYSSTNTSYCFATFILRRQVFGTKSANYLCPAYVAWRRRSKTRNVFSDGYEYHRTDGAAVIYINEDAKQFHVFGHRGSPLRSEEAIATSTTPQRLATLTRDSNKAVAYLAAHNKHCPPEAKTVYALTRQHEISERKWPHALA